MHARLTLAALAALFAPAALAQSPVDFLPREPGLAAPPERVVTPPPPAEETGPISAVAADGGPGIVLGGITLEGVTAIDPAELEPIWAELIGQPVTLTALEDIAARIGAAYRARGFVLSQAVLPAQTVENGQVTILVVEGFVNRVEITGGADNQNAYAQTRFAPVTAERPLSLSTLERGILLSRDTFGGTVETVLEPSARHLRRRRSRRADRARPDQLLRHHRQPRLAALRRMDAGRRRAGLQPARPERPARRARCGGAEGRLPALRRAGLRRADPPPERHPVRRHPLGGRDGHLARRPRSRAERLARHAGDHPERNQPARRRRHAVRPDALAEPLRLPRPRISRKRKRDGLHRTRHERNRPAGHPRCRPDLGRGRPLRRRQPRRCGDPAGPRYRRRRGRRHRTGRRPP